MRRGQIYYVTKGYTHGSEQEAGRPAIIVSNDCCNKTSDVVEVVYLTTKEKNELPTHVSIICKTPSTALCEQIHSVYKERVGSYITTCTEDEMKAIDKALCVSLGIEIPKNATVTPKEPIKETVVVPPQIDEEKIRLEAERDVFKKLYMDLLSKTS